jgi:hypothetical protein
VLLWIFLEECNIGEWIFNLSRDEKISLLKYKGIYDDRLTEYIIDKIVYITNISVLELKLDNLELDNRSYFVQVFSTNYKPINYIAYG